ncbi:uncharacterized protein A1O5_01505 [Cladophialophora psammophila CBS 110553]|uniref:Nephrocystin 3-like N-terminal domain-containing protein n=1 Tax=Cladophialophora psammophila CBS 110553 TaxID=1182543 RepID=W9XX22_9EURO|nr:uncharacterized protein A1O5_01505 [Cladophialophora psammophila CBS 110553]EXJ74809.1 hypothetical protein A1O5_01505 [Cladophialophora psammophila CBS 110553]
MEERQGSGGDFHFNQTRGGRWQVANVINNYPSPAGHRSTTHEELLERLEYTNRTARERQLGDTKHRDATLRWVWSSPFATWLSNPDRIFWIHGKPGSGKSTLASYLAHADDTKELLSLHTGTNYTLIYFFFDFRQEDKIPNSFHGLLLSLLYQLERDLKVMQTYIEKSEWKTVKECHLWPTSELQRILQAGLSACADKSLPLCIFVDGLDEYNGDMLELSKFLKGISALGQTKLCLSSRLHPILNGLFSGLPALSMTDWNNKSLRQFTAAILRELPVLESSPESLQRISMAVVEKAEGVFLWASYAVKELTRLWFKGYSTVDELLKGLKELPQDLEDLWSRMLSSMEPADREQTGVVLQLVCFSARTLKLEDLLAALRHALPTQQNRFQVLCKDRQLSPLIALNIITMGLVELVEPEDEDTLYRAGSLSHSRRKMQNMFSQARRQARRAAATMRKTSENQENNIAASADVGFGISVDDFVLAHMRDRLRVSPPSSSPDQGSPTSGVALPAQPPKDDSEESYTSEQSEDTEGDLHGFGQRSRPSYHRQRLLPRIRVRRPISMVGPTIAPWANQPSEVLEDDSDGDEEPVEVPFEEREVKLVHKTVRTYLEAKGWAQLSTSPFQPEAIWLKVCIATVLEDGHMARHVKLYRNRARLDWKGHCSSLLTESKSENCYWHYRRKSPKSDDSTDARDGVSVQDILYYARCLEQNRNISSWPLLNQVLCPEFLSLHGYGYGSESCGSVGVNASNLPDSIVGLLVLYGLRLYLKDAFRAGQTKEQARVTPGPAGRAEPVFATNLSSKGAAVTEPGLRKDLLYAAIGFAARHTTGMPGNLPNDGSDVSLIESVLDIDDSIHDSDIIHAMQGASAKVVEVLLNALPPDRTTFSYHDFTSIEKGEANRAKPSRGAWVCRFDPREPVGALWIAARESQCDTEAKFDLLLDREEAIDACWGRNGTAMHANFFRDQHLVPGSFHDGKPGDQVFRVKRMLLARGSKVKLDLDFWRFVKMVQEAATK